MNKTLKIIAEEYLRDGKLSNSSLLKLRDAICNENKYSAISLAADCKASSLASEIAMALESDEEMVRWIAISTLLSRFKLKQYAQIGLHHAQYDTDEMVKGIAISGLGEILPLISNKSLSREISIFLINTFEKKPTDEYIDYREDAYEAILAAMSISPLERPSANKHLDLDTDVDHNIVQSFKKLYFDS